MRYRKLFSGAAEPAAAENRFERLIEEPSARGIIESMSDPALTDLVTVIGLSRFLFHLLCRYPQLLEQFSRPEPADAEPADMSNADRLRLYKYRELLRITRLDLAGSEDYPRILQALSHLAERVFNAAFRLAVQEPDRRIIEQYFCTFALGKLGAMELNYSSDIDLIFVCANPSDVPLPVHGYQQILQDGIRALSSQLEQRTVDGFLYRVDLKLRPWGRSGPLVMAIDETENYYAASSEAWERFAWLRARTIHGSATLAGDMQTRLQPFVYRRSLGMDDLERFIEIKNEMYRVRRRKGYWNVKLGEGGIRDIEFFIQMLQIVNAATHPHLQTTGTLQVLHGLCEAGLVTATETQEVEQSYLFLRRLENRLQMIDEQQTHELPDEQEKRLIIARSMGLPGRSDDEILDNFESALVASRAIAQSYFERILPQKTAQR